MSRASRRSAIRLLRPAMVAVVLTGLATLPAALPGRPSPVIAALVYVLAVAGASAAGGLTAGLAASVLSFFGLNFFFTPPLHTLSVERTDDLAALAVFLAVSAIVGTLLSRALDQRARAERREREARLLHHVATRLLSGDALEDVLERFGRAITDLLALARCELRAEPLRRTIVVQGESEVEGGREVVSMAAGGREAGQVVAVLPPGRQLLEEERSVIATFAGQMGLALEGARLAGEADRARMDAEKNRLRAALFSSVTHDLRTPLASITASVTTLQGVGDDLGQHDRRDLLETIRQEAERLNRLVGNLMHLSQIRAGALTPEKVRADLDELIEGVVARLRPVLRQHRIRLVLREGLPSVPMDVVQMDQALTNLLENAARFAPPGSEIAVYAARFRDEVEARVSDRGPGIPAEERERVMEPFVRGEATGGTGLGLSIARAIVESHGGRIWIRDTPGGGTTVVFRLPLR
ncbi:MAG TPA: ATP-binding protein [Actinomycetota bacterium]|nr:ATP-binding protein [Actinomycetota bacterium]